MEEKTKKKFYKRAWFWVVVVIVFFIIVGSSGSSKDKNGQTTSNTQLAPQEQAIKVTASQIVSEYEANEILADSKYKNKLIEVTGTIKSISKDILDQPYLSLEGSNILSDVQCMFDEDNQDQLASLNKDTKITLQGKVEGKMMNIIVRSCSIVK